MTALKSNLLCDCLRPSVRGFLDSSLQMGYQSVTVPQLKDKELSGGTRGQAQTHTKAR